MKFKFTISVLYLMSFSIFAFDNQWSYESNQPDGHKLSFTITDGGEKYKSSISASYKNKDNKKIFDLFDYIEECSVDSYFKLSEDSVEILDLFGNGENVVLFSYFRVCDTDEDNVDTKYFAYHNGQKFSLKGTSTTMTYNKIYKPDNAPVPSENLKTEPKLLEYMMEKWLYVSTVQPNLSDYYCDIAGSEEKACQ